MLTENEVVQAVVQYLSDQGYEIDQALSTSQKGIDIEATHPARGKSFVEAKGATSSIITSKRYGKEFDSKQIKKNVGVALLKSFQTMQLHPESIVAIALPNNEGHRKVIESIKEPIKNSVLKVYMVNNDASIYIYI